MSPQAADLRSLTSARSGGVPAGSIELVVPRPRARWRTRVLVPLVVLGATAGILAYAARDALRPTLDVWVAPVVPATNALSTGAAAPSDGAEGHEASAVVPANAGPGAVIVQAPGWIEPAPYAVSVPALAEGVVRDVLVLEGESVQPGQVVARFVDEDARLQVRAAKAALDERAADVRRAVAAVASAEAQVRVERAAAAELRDEVDSKRDLVGNGAVGAGVFRRMEIRLEGQDANVASTERFADEARAAQGQAEAALASAQVGVDEAELRLQRMEIRAPRGGVVLARLVEPGVRISMAAAGGEGPMAGAVLRLYDPGSLQVRVDVPLADVGNVGIGTHCSMTSEALPEVTIHGQVVRVVHEANIQRNTVQFKVSVQDPSPVLKPEMLMRVKLHAPAGVTPGDATSKPGATATDSSDGSVVLVPAATLNGVSGESASVWVAEVSSGLPVARRREVRFKAGADPAYVVVSSGLRITDRVIVEPSNNLRDGMPVRVMGERAGTPPGNP